jgi:Ca2+:H+ antiporter
MSRANSEPADIPEDTALLSETNAPLGRQSLLVILAKESVQAVYATLASSKANILLVFVPLGIIANAFDWSDASTFILNFFAVLALASVLSYSTDELSAKVGQTIGGLINASFGNMVELLVSLTPRSL